MAFLFGETPFLVLIKEVLTCKYNKIIINKCGNLIGEIEGVNIGKGNKTQKR